MSPKIEYIFKYEWVKPKISAGKLGIIVLDNKLSKKEIKIRQNRKITNFMLSIKTGKGEKAFQIHTLYTGLDLSSRKSIYTSVELLKSSKAKGNR